MASRTTPTDSWKRRLPPALFRVFVALGMLAVPTFEERFGLLGLPLMCGALAGGALLAALAMRSMLGENDWSIPVVDAVTLIIVIPAAVMASGIVVADARLGGGAEYFAAAAAAVVGATAIVALVALLLNGGSPELATLGLLPAPLVVAAVIAGAERFGAGALEQGLSIAWIVAALLTLVDGLVGAQVRTMLAPIGFSLFTVAIVVVARSETSSAVTAANSSLALVATALAGATLLAVPMLNASGSGPGPIRRDHS